MPADGARQEREGATTGAWLEIGMKVSYRGSRAGYLNREQMNHGEGC